MKRFLKSKLFLSLVAVVLLASAIAIPLLSGSVKHSHAQAPQGSNQISPDCAAAFTKLEDLFTQRAVSLQKLNTIQAEIQSIERLNVAQITRRDLQALLSDIRQEAEVLKTIHRIDDETKSVVHFLIENACTTA